ncbi:hypothetical protein BJY52DRAFT_1290590 [Lactarius psammicola]|nr:hypothetical protein BJY52DRAFT_1290590 [Lactarius psammicola]
MPQVDLSGVRWNAANGMSPEYKPEGLPSLRWGNEGALDPHMERFYQMHVIPDVFPDPPPKNAALRARAEKKSVPVAAGTRRPPKLYVTVFHPEPRSYTLLMVDRDVPDEENQSFKTYLHLLS